MTTPCTRCGSPVAADELRCPACDALAPVPEDDDVVAEAGTDAPPWAIPIREPSVAPAEAGEPTLVDRLGGERSDVVRLAALGLLAVAVFAATVVIGAQLLTDGGGQTRAVDRIDAEDVTGPESRRVRVDTEADAEDEPTTTTTSSTTSSTSSSTTTTTTTSTTTTRPPAPSGTGSVPTLPSSFDGGWVAQLTSVPYAAGADRLDASWETARGYAPDAVATRSDDWSSLRDGFWVLVEPGPFASADDVRAFCAAVDHAGEGDCIPRELDGRA